MPFTLPRNLVYPALLPLIRAPRLPVVEWIDAPRRYKRTRSFRRKTKSGLCACAITFQLASASSRVETESGGTRKRTGGEVKGKEANGVGTQQSCTESDTVYLALLTLMRTPRLPAADRTDTPADVNGLVRFAERPNPVSARVPSRSVFTLLAAVKFKI